MNQTKIYAHLPQKLIIIGFGTIAKGVLPLVFRHLEVKASDITIIAANGEDKTIAQEFGVQFIEKILDKNNYFNILNPLINENDFVLNLSVNVCSFALIELCNEKKALYLDTCIEPWEGEYTDLKLPLAERTNYALREKALALRKKLKNHTTALIACGANPGLISHFLKQALINIAEATKLEYIKPTSKADWGHLAKKLGIQAIHIAEIDTQVSSKPKKSNEFVNTWSVDGFVSEGCQPAELGWGTHEKHMPDDGNHFTFGSNASIYLNKPGASQRVRSWTPTGGAYHGFLITHNEAISIADFLTVKEGDKIVYRPTVHYAYLPCNDAVLSIHELAGKNWRQQLNQRILFNEITSGFDELGILLMGHDKNAYWYGSKLTNEEAKQLVPYNNATSLQVAIAVLAGMVWVINNPKKGIVESDDTDYEEQLKICFPYLGEMIGQFTDWNPTLDRDLFPEEIEKQELWQFNNFRVN